jgi:hypothetical protein
VGDEHFYPLIGDERFCVSVVQEALQAENQNHSFFLAVEVQGAAQKAVEAELFAPLPTCYDPV